MIHGESRVFGPGSFLCVSCCVLCLSSNGVFRWYSEILELGCSRRLFSPALKHALADRAGGCAWTGCPHPPAYAHAHHIRWWDRDTGPTDLTKGQVANTSPSAPLLKSHIGVGGSAPIR